MIPKNHSSTGDRLIVGSNDDGFLAQTIYGDDWEAYAFAYKKAADCLVEQIHEKTVLGNLFICPMAFLYRHYFELRLKKLIHDAGELEGVQEFTGNQHGLLSLWRRCRPFVEKWIADVSKAELDAVEETLDQFSNLDPNAQAARYPCDSQRLRASNLVGLKINVKNFGETVSKTANLLDAVADQFAELKKNRFY